MPVLWKIIRLSVPVLVLILTDYRYRKHIAGPVRYSKTPSGLVVLLRLSFVIIFIMLEVAILMIAAKVTQYEGGWHGLCKSPYAALAGLVAFGCSHLIFEKRGEFLRRKAKYIPAIKHN